MNRDLLINGDVTLRDAIAQLDVGGRGVLFVTDSNSKLIGIVTDGDIRRAILKNASLYNPISEIMNREFIAWPKECSTEDAVRVMKRLKKRHMPITDENGILVNIVLLDDIAFQYHENTVVIMAGGLGSRLGDLTKDCPKPLLRIGNRPIMETIINNFVDYGFRNFHLAVNYKAEMIEEYFGNGDKWGSRIHYIREEEKLGTAGALSLLSVKPTKPIIVMNGDLLTKINFQHLLDYHIDHRAKATVCVREYDMQIPFGVLQLEKDYSVKNITEKPVNRCFINAGIYILDPDVLELIPKRQSYDMPSLLDRIIASEQKVCAFPIMEYWLDIGRVGDFERANNEYQTFFGNP